MMQRKPLSDQHCVKLAEYGLQAIPLDSCVCLKFHAGETILQEGMPITYLFVVLSGSAKVCSTARNGKNLVLCYYICEGLMGDLELMTDTYIATTSIVAVTDFECIAIPFQRNALYLKSNVRFLNRLGSELALKLIRSSQNFVSASLYSGEERLCAYILQTSHNGIFSDILTDTACSVGMSYRHMFRLLNRLCEDGVLEKRENGYRILDRESLAEKATEFL